MQRLGNTTPHFIRCIKPNNVQSPGLYEQGLVLQQLRCCGVLEVVRISRSGFPTRMSHQKFSRRYGFLLLESIAAKDPLSVSVAILHQFNILPEMYQVGYTKLFFRTGQIQGIALFMGSYVSKAVLEGTKHGFRLFQINLSYGLFIPPVVSVVRGEKVRKECTELLRRHRASAAIQSHVKRRIAKRQYKATVDASVVIQSAIRGELVRRCAGDIGWLKSGGTKRNESDEVLVKASVISELQRRVLKSEAALREKEEENDILRQRLQQYDNRWSEYETKMKSMEEIWQKQMRSLQSSLSIAKKSLEVEDSARNSDASVNASDATELSGSGGDFRTHGRTRSVGVGLSVISRLAEEFGQRAQVFGDDTKFLMEVKSGQVEANLDPERELRRLKQMFDTWKKDYGGRLRETKLILGKLGSGESGGSAERVKMKWWGRLKSTRSEKALWLLKRVMFLISIQILANSSSHLIFEASGYFFGPMLEQALIRLSFPCSAHGYRFQRNPPQLAWSVSSQPVVIIRILGSV
ncbi:hypothetical protein YC2023_075532 [Brassica napus]